MEGSARLAEIRHTHAKKNHSARRAASSGRAGSSGTTAGAAASSGNNGGAAVHGGSAGSPDPAYVAVKGEADEGLSSPPVVKPVRSSGRPSKRPLALMSCQFLDDDDDLEFDEDDDDDGMGGSETSEELTYEPLARAMEAPSARPPSKSRPNGGAGKVVNGAKDHPPAASPPVRPPLAAKAPAAASGGGGGANGSASNTRKRQSTSGTSQRGKHGTESSKRANKGSALKSLKTEIVNVGADGQFVSPVQLPPPTELAARYQAVFLPRRRWPLTAPFRVNAPQFPTFGRRNPGVPDGVVTTILSYVANEDIYNASLVCLAWASLAMDNFLWDWDGVACQELPVNAQFPLQVQYQQQAHGGQHGGHSEGRNEFDSMLQLTPQRPGRGHASALPFLYSGEEEALQSVPPSPLLPAKNLLVSHGLLTGVPTMSTAGITPLCADAVRMSLMSPLLSMSPDRPVVASTFAYVQSPVLPSTLPGAVPSGRSRQRR